MASVFPGALDSFATNKADGTATPTDHPTHHNDLADAVNKIEAALGANLSALRAPYSIGNAADVWWDADSGDFTELTVTGAQTILESPSRLSVDFNGQTAGDYNAFLKAHTFVIGDAFVVPLQGLALDPTGAEHTGAGLVFSNGVLSSSTALVGHLQWDPGAQRHFLVGRHGTFTALTTVPWVSAFPVSPWMPALYIKLTYLASNSFRLEFSPDGLLFSAFAEADIAVTMVPTHFGLAWADQSGGPNAIASFGPIAKVA